MDSVEFCPWTIMRQWSMVNIKGVHGQCAVRSWTMSRESMDFVPGFFLYTLFRIWFHEFKNCSNPTKLNAYIQFTMHVIYFSYHTMPTCPTILPAASKIRLPAPCRGDVALQYAKPGSSVNSPNGPGGERAIAPSTLPVTCEMSKCY